MTIFYFSVNLVVGADESVLMLQAYDQKNIRRRVYDALNVLMAMNIISKEKKEIKWIGLPTNSAQECQQLEVCHCSSFWESCSLSLNWCHA